jgi:hypothetical protein
MSIEVVKKLKDGVIAKDGNKFILVDDSFDRVLDKEIDCEKVQQIPRIGKERDVLYITGQSGSGKTYYTIQYLKEYRKLYKHNDIYLFSAIKNEGRKDAYNEKGLDVQRIKMEHEDLKTLDAKDFENCCVIFDDMDCYKDKVIFKNVSKLRDEILETGRHYNTTVIITYHLPCNGHDTKRLLQESTSITYFPRYAKPKIAYMLKTYVGLSDEQIVKNKRSKSRWCTIMTTAPSVVLTEKKVYVLDDGYDDESNNSSSSED